MMRIFVFTTIVIVTSTLQGQRVVQVDEISQLPEQRSISITPECFIPRGSGEDPPAVLEHSLYPESSLQPQGVVSKRKLLELETFYPPRENTYVPGELCIQFWDVARGALNVTEHDGAVTTGIALMDALNEQYAVLAMNRLVENIVLPPHALEYRLDLMYVLSMNEHQDMEAVAAEYRALPMVKCAHPNYVPFPATITKTYPNDTYFDWAPNITQGPKAWTFSTGDNTDTLGIIDVEQFNNNHADLNNNYAGVSGGTAPLGTGSWHGTGCASHACSELNSSAGVSGTAGGWSGSQGILWMPYRINSTADNVTAVSWMVSNGACVISQAALYLATPEILEDAYANALTNNVLAFAAAGNDNNYYATNMWPAYFDCVVAVGGVDNFGRHWAWDDSSGSCYGDWIELTGPGETHWTCNATGYTGSYGGTSWATPRVAGIAALVVNQRGIRGTALRDAMLRAADASDHLNEDLYSYGANPQRLTGWGRINAYEAIMTQYKNVSVNWIAASSNLNPFINCYDQYLDFDSHDSEYGRHSHSFVPRVAVTPRAMVQNRGTTTESFTVTAQSSGYSSSKLVSGLSSGEARIVEFDPFTPGISSSYTLTVYASLSNDQNTANDTCSVNFINSYTDTLQCDGGDYTVQYTDAWAAWALSFTPERPCTLKALQVRAGRSGTIGEACTLIVWENVGGKPGNRLYTQRIQQSATADGWNTFAGINYAIAKPVFVGLKTRGGSGGTYFRPCVDRRWDCGRSWFSASGGADGASDWGTLNSDLLLRLVLRYDQVDTYDAAMISIDAPPSFVASGSGQLPRATIRNAGRFTVSLQIMCNIDSAGTNIYQQTANVNFLQPNEIREVMWSTPWVPNWNGTYNMTMYADGVYDDFRGNDTLTLDIQSNSTVTMDAGEGSAAHYTSTTGYYAVQFEPAGPCSVTAGIITIYLVGAGSGTCSLYVWDDNNGEPGNVVRGPIEFSGTPYYPTWNTIAVLPTSYYTTSKFWLGTYSPGGVSGNSKSILMDANDNNGRSKVANTPTGSWILGSHNWLIHAQVKYISSYANDVGVQSIDAPASVAKPNFAVLPKATIKNVGRNTIANFNVHCQIDTAGTVIYTSTKSVSSILPTETQQISFDPWTPTEQDQYYKQTIALSGMFTPFDNNSSNDTLIDSTLCSALDIISYNTGLNRYWGDATNVYVAQRFTPELPCTVLGTWIALYAPGGWGNACSTFLWNEADYDPDREWPGTLVWSEQWTPSSGGNAAWFRRDIPARYYERNVDFFIGGWAPTGASGEPDFLLDAWCDYGRSWYDTGRDSAWWDPLQGDWAIEALVKYMGGESHVLRGYVNSVSSFSGDSLRFRSYLLKNPDQILDETSSGTAISYLGSNQGLWQVDCRYFWPTWTLTDRVMTIIDYETGSGTTGHTGFYGVMIDTLLLEINPQHAPACSLRQVPVPTWSILYWWSDKKIVNFTWNAPITDVGNPDTSYIAGYNVYRSADGVNFSHLRTLQNADDTTFNDTVLPPYTTYYYAIKLLYTGTTFSKDPTFESQYLSAHTMVNYIGVNEQPDDVPMIFALGAAYPNPAAQHTVLRYAIPQATRITVQIFDVTGRLVRTVVNDDREPGYYTVSIEKGELAAGIYFCKLQCNACEATSKFIFAR